ncbi:hypothetical protein MLD38_007628 [Melastoma candidum]|uniref:Uncharacterized protein n=1 Tax=Melastoma candidum TaxID=119954 RepID=A0ACB9RRE7_9MYRT|nr:hypothetical protein MLD38_007628 [Melastoma candidum]
MSSDSAIVLDPPPSPRRLPPQPSFGCLDVPPLDPLFLSSSSSASSPSDDPISNPSFVPAPNFDLELDLDFLLDDNAGFEVTFDNIDDLYLPSETESFLIPQNTSSSSASDDDQVRADCTVPSEGGGNEIQVCSPDRENSTGLASSQGSGGDVGGSGLSEDMNSPSPSSGNHDRDRDVSSESFPVQKVKLEVSAKNCGSIGGDSIMKRKKDHDDASTETRVLKFRKSASKGEDDVSFGGKADELKDEEDDKRKARLMRNRESAQLSRQRKKHYVEEMEEKIRLMQTTITDLNGKISFMMAENMSLRQQLSSASNVGMPVAPPAIALPPPGMYPHPPMPYPWVPCAPYMVKPQGQVPLVPIPRLKPQQPAMASTAKVKKESSKKVESKSTRKVASISLLGVLFFMLMFGVMVPKVNISYGGVGDFPGQAGHSWNRYHHGHYHRERILTVSEHSNVSLTNTGGKCRGDSEDQPLPHRNGSEPLIASLYVPRNDKLVKIDGNLIIHSVLASEKAMTAQASHKMEDEATRHNLASALAIRDSTIIRGVRSAYSKATEQKVLGPGVREKLNDNEKAAPATDGKLQQWFREGLAGPLLSSGMCTEVFQFDVSPASAGAIIPAPPSSNITSAERRNTTSDHRVGKNRRILGRVPSHLPGSGTNITDRQARGSMKDDNLSANKSLTSSMVVSLLVDPREAGGDGDIDGVIQPKSISRIFVVVLMDSIKYVTYSCVLPRSGAGMHFVTA